MGANNGEANTAQNGQNAVSDEEVRQHSAEAAQKSLQAQQSAYELRQAAHGAADANERQKLMEEAIDKEIEAESFGKTAKYLRSGTFQGFAMGTGMGVAPGASLGALTGTLVGGVTSLITGGLGGAIGAGVGALHGPWWNMGEVAGKGIQKVTGNAPSRKATWEQKQVLEQMVTDVRNQDMPNKGELEGMQRDNPAKALGKSASSMMPSMSWPSWGKSKDKDGQKESKDSKEQPSSYSSHPKRDPATVQRADEQGVRRLQEAQSRAEQTKNEPSAQASNLHRGSTVDKARQSTGQAGPRKQPRKLEVRKNPASQAPGVNKDSQPVKKKPRKLETRSKAVASAG